MPRIAELRRIDDQIWARLEIEGDSGQVTIWTPDEIKHAERSAIKNFLIDIFQYHVGDW